MLQPVEQGAVPAALAAGMVAQSDLGGLVHGIDKQAVAEMASLGSLSAVESAA